MHRIFIDGREGTTGLRIYERIQAVKDIELLLLSEEDRKDSKKRQEMIHASDVTFLCLPDAAAKEAVALAQGSSTRIIDASTAHRTKDDFVYGFAELGDGQYGAIAKGDRIAVPGCHASGYIALIYPLVQAGLLSPSAHLCCTSLTGYSGGGKSTIAAYQDEKRSAEYESPRHYALAQTHKHLKEMSHISGVQAPPVFNPVIGDFYAGMIVSVPLHAALLEKKAGAKDIAAVYGAHYANRPLIRVLPYTGENGFYAANALAGYDTMEIVVTGNDERLTLMARYDNLGKGASGAAVQCMNIMLGKDETDTLKLH
ncbi:N-acetyl-gamma-glutamyl-phosphate reductase [Christensenellaceae bacterium OttesenSCG-928-M15]|nr:N-acetyl-gamma-glutamyl-phosphate reductase [Christensenellaceae bacterium OttesenSCG-928-M15]